VFEQMFDATRVAVTSTPTSTRVGPGVDECRGGAMRQYDDPVEVRRGEAEDPEQFLWRGRLWKVRAVVAHWVETGPWWQASTSRPAGPGSGHDGAVTDLVAERELWRVEAGRGAQAFRHDLRPADDPDQQTQETYGVFDLSFDWSDGRWQLVGCLD
jgi:hypothetical protein